MMALNGSKEMTAKLRKPVRNLLHLKTQNKTKMKARIRMVAGIRIVLEESTELCLVLEIQIIFI